MKIVFLFLFISSLAEATELRRETNMSAGECETQDYSPALVKATAYVNIIKDRIVAANPEVFRGDLAPPRICAGVKNTESQRAWAATRSFVIEAGLILRVQNDAQLAYAIAHELAHLTMRHSLDGVPVTGNNRESVRATQQQVQELAAQVLQLQKGSQAHANNFASLSARLDAASALVTNAIIAEFGADTANNWDEGEADLVGSHLMLRAGFSGKEVAWRIQQLAISQEAGLDNHSPAPQISSEERIARALSACGVSSLARMTEPARGNGPYPNACWSIWKLTKDEPAKNSAYRNLLSGEGLVNLPGSPTLSEAQAEIRANVLPPPTEKDGVPISAPDDEEEDEEQQEPKPETDSDNENP